jgi:hypothetical protein
MDWIRRSIGRTFGFNSEMTLREFLLPGDAAEPGGRSAILKRFEVRPRKSANSNGTYADEADNEYVYDLEPSRYPVKIQLEEDLPKRMTEQLKQIIDEKLVSPKMQEDWDLWKSVFNKPIGSRSDTTLLLPKLWDLVIGFFNHIRPNDECQSESRALTRDQRVMTDLCITMDSKTVILVDAINPMLSGDYAIGLVGLASGKRPSGFEGELPEVLYAHEGILAKVTPIFLFPRFWISNDE